MSIEMTEPKGTATPAPVEQVEFDAAEQKVQLFREMLADPTYLPFRSVVADAFPLGRKDNVQVWHDYINDDNYPKFEIFTVEYIEALGAYLADPRAI